MDYRLIALDMDGTVLSPDTTITETTAGAINQALAAGVQVVFCSGRCVEEIRPYVAPFPQMRYVICENGSYVMDLQTGEYIDYRGLERWITDRIMKEAETHDVLIQMGSGGKYYMQDWTLDRLAEFGLEKYGDLMVQTGEFVHDLVKFYRTFDGRISKINFYTTNLKERANIIESLQADQLPLNYVSGLADNIEMISYSAGKGVGLTALCGHLHLTRDQVIAVGDNNNDISMLHAAGLAVAMGNAVPELKAVADEVTGDNAHDGVAEVIRKYILY